MTTLTKEDICPVCKQFPVVWSPDCMNCGCATRDGEMHSHTNWRNRCRRLQKNTGDVNDIR